MTVQSFFKNNCLKIWFQEQINFFSTLECQFSIFFYRNSSSSNCWLWLRVFQIIQYSFYRCHLLEFTVSWGEEAPYQKKIKKKKNDNLPQDFVKQWEMVKFTMGDTEKFLKSLFWPEKLVNISPHHTKRCRIATFGGYVF